MVRVVYREYDRMMGQRDFHANEFKTIEEAEKEVERVLKENSGKNITPDCYIRARIEEL